MNDLIPSSEMPRLFKGTTSQTWNQLRHKGAGPIYVKVANRVYYRRQDIDAWIEGNLMARTDIKAS